MKRLLTLVFIFLGLQIGPFAALGQDSVISYEAKNFIDDFKKSVENRNLESYREAFSSDLRNIEGEKFKIFFREFSMNSVSVESISINEQNLYQSRVYLTLIFQNSYSVILDTWLLDVMKVNGDWKILNKDTIGQAQTLYKLKIPCERRERVKKVEVKHKDISISFKNSIVFYDNVPDLETALIVIGHGEIKFTPSLSQEQHHLEMMYHKKSLKSRIESIYLRFSPTFFKNNIKIAKEELGGKPIDMAEYNLAQAIFKKSYPRSFTVKSSLTHDFFSILPKGEEAAFEFKIKEIGEMIYIFSPFAFEEINLYQWKKEKIVCLYSPPLEEEGKRMFISFGQKVDIKDYRLDLSYEPERSYFSGKARITFESNVGNLNSVQLKLNPQLKILRVIDKNQNSLYFSQDDFRKTVYVYLLDRLPRGKLGEIDIYYSGKLSPLKEGHEGAEALQRTAEIEFLETMDKSYFYSRSSYWYPAPPREDYFTAQLKLKLPPGYSAVSNGKLVSDQRKASEENVEVIDKEDYSLNIFEVKDQIKYLAFIVGKLSKEGEIQEPICIDYYTTPKVGDYDGDLFRTVRDIVDFYQKRFGPYPFDKLSIVRQVGKSKWGHSPPGFVIITDLPPMDRVHYRRMASSPVDLSNWHEYFLAHEIAHQWWGHGVSWNSYRDLWISEGLAQFSASFYLKEKYGQDAFSEMLKKFSKLTRKNTKWGAITMGSRISHLNFEAFQSIIYNKTALVLNMLRDFLGNDMFFLGMQRFFSHNKYCAADTHSFIKIFNELEENDLGPFFKNWFHSYHLPEARIFYSLEKNDSKFILRLRVCQDERFFMFPLWLEWKEDGNKIREKVWIDKKVAGFEFKLTHRPKKIKINPDDAVPGRFSINKS